MIYKPIQLSEIFNGDVDEEAVKKLFERVGTNLAGYMMEEKIFPLHEYLIKLDTPVCPQCGSKECSMFGGEALLDTNKQVKAKTNYCCASCGNVFDVITIGPQRQDDPRQAHAGDEREAKPL
jgi:DNA-directed RNA polymerase subunit RPC12/RpoP